MELIIIFLILFKTVQSLQDDVHHLTNNFFANLHAHTKEYGVNETFIDSQVNSYIDLIQSHSNRVKRGIERLQEDEYGIFNLKEIKELNRIPMEHPQDAMIFKQIVNETCVWYSAVIDHQQSSLNLLKYNGTHFNHLIAKQVKNGSKLGIHTTINGTFIVVAEHTIANTDFANKTAIYYFTIDEILFKIQNLAVDYASDVAIWNDKSELFMVVTQQKSNESLVYKWSDGYFDNIQKLTTHGAVKVTPFVIGRSQFIAIANQEDPHGNSMTFSQIFKYDLNSEKFIKYQMIQTEGVSDIQVFCFKKDEQSEYFLIVGNAYHKTGNNTIVYTSNSIVYKFVNDYFVPFQKFDIHAVTNWLPITGANGEFALVAVSKFEGLEIFQYNGWKFEKSIYQLSNLALNRGVSSINFMIFHNKPVIVIANNYDNGTMANFYEFVFEKRNELTSFYDNMLSWCKNSLQEIKGDNSNQHKIIARSVDKEGVESNADAISDIQSRLNKQDGDLKHIELSLQKTSQEVQVIDGAVSADNIILNEEIFFDNIVTGNLNTWNTVDLLKNVIPITSRTFLDSLELDAAMCEKLNISTLINNHNVDELIFKNQDVELHSVNLIGTATFTNNLFVGGMINNVNFTKKNVLMYNGDQELLGDLHVEDIGADHINTEFLNKLPLENDFNKVVKTIPVDNLEELSVNKLTIGGFVNNLDLGTIDKYALRAFGDQELTTDYLFEDLRVDNLQTLNFLNQMKIPESLVFVNDGAYEVQQSVEFLQDFIADSISITNRLNHIKVIKSKLNLLLKNSSDIQFINGPKQFDTVEVLNSINLRGKLENLVNLNPVQLIQDENELFGDYIIRGNVTVENVATIGDIKPDGSDLSINFMRENGLKVNDIEVAPHLTFTQQLNLPHITAERINGINPNLFVVNGGDNVQYIRGWKLFDKDLTITGNSNIQIVNNIDLSQMEANVLRLEGNQIIRGKHYIANMETEQLSGENINILNQKLSNIVTINSPQILEADTIVSNLIAGKLRAQNLTIKGRINGINFNEMLDDTVFLNSTKQVQGSKAFGNLTINHIVSRKSMNLRRIPNLIRRAEAIFHSDANIALPNNLSIETIHVNNKINDYDAFNLNTNWIEQSGDQTITGDQYFDKITIYGDSFVASNMINEMQLEDFNENTVKIDEDHDFGTVIFEQDLISLDYIDLSGHYEDLDIDNIAATNGDALVLSNITFKENVTVAAGRLDLGEKINNFPIRSLCEFSRPREDEPSKHLIINGNADFIKGPVLLTINGADLPELLSTTWMNHKICTLDGFLATGNITFKDEVVVNNFVDGVNLAWLESNYFSKSRNQSIPAQIDFDGGVKFLAGVSAAQAKVLENVCGIDLHQFISTVLLQDVEQEFYHKVLMENVTINDLQGEFLVNNVNINQVMRYDIPNVVTGKKIFNNVKAKNLLIAEEQPIMVQNVDVLNWIQNGLSKTITRQIEKRIIFNNETIFNKGIALKGLLNEHEFNSNAIMLKSIDQNISGKKSFLSDHVFPLEFEQVKIAGMVNNAKLNDLMQAQAKKNEDNTFTSQVDLNNSVYAENINFEGNYQGVNITQLLHNLTHFVNLNNYYNQYAKLQEVSGDLKTSLDLQAKYINYYKVIQIFENALEVFPFRNLNNLYSLVVLRLENTTYLIDLFEWNESTGVFNVNEKYLEISFKDRLTYLAPIEYDDKSYLFLEYIHYDSLGNTRLAKILSYDTDGAFKVMHLIPSNGTNSIHALTIQNKTCILLSYRYTNFLQMLCDSNEQLSLHQRFEINSALAIRITKIEDCIYIIAVDEGRYNNDASIIIWKYDENSEFFNEHQRIFIAKPVSISVIEHNGVHYLAIASGHLLNTLYGGQVEIRRFNKDAQSFEMWHDFSANAPLQVNFALLPSNELMLYVLCNNPTKPLMIYKYEGINKFVKAGAASSIQNAYSLALFSTPTKHFLITKSDNYFNVIQGIFKGIE